MSNLDEMYNEDQRQLQEQEEELFAYYESLGMLEHVNDEDYYPIDEDGYPLPKPGAMNEGYAGMGPQDAPKQDEEALEELDFNEKAPSGSILDLGRGLV